MNPKPLIIGAAAVAAAYFLLKPDGLLSNLFNSQAGGSAEGGGGGSDSGGSPYYRLTDEQPASYWQQDPKPDPTPAPSPTPNPTPDTAQGTTPAAPTPADTQPATANPNRPSYVDTIENIGTVAFAAGGTAWAAKEILGGGRGAKLFDVAKNIGRKALDVGSKVLKSPYGKIGVATAGIAALYAVSGDIEPTPGKPKNNMPEWADKLNNWLTGKGYTPTTDTPKPSMGFGGSWGTPASTITTSQPATANPNRPSATAYTTTPGSTGTGTTFTDTKSGGSITVSSKIAAAINSVGSVRYSSSPSSPSKSSNIVRGSSTTVTRF